MKTNEQIEYIEDLKLNDFDTYSRREREREVKEDSIRRSKYLDWLEEKR